MKYIKSRIALIVFIAFGLLLAASAIVSGPHAFQHGRIGVVLLVLAGAVCTIAGLYEFMKLRAKNNGK